MSCFQRRPFGAAVRAIIHTVVMVMVAGACGMFETFGGVVRASDWSDASGASVGTTAACSAVAGDRRLLRVRLIPKKQVDAEMIEIVQREVVELWRDYGVDIVWEGPTTELDTDRRPELYVQFVGHELGRDVQHRGRGVTAVAWILFVSGKPGQVINVSLAAAERLLNDAPWLDARPMRHAPIDLQRRLTATMTGRALAHEIGHYLLASSKHADDGLMKPMITPAEFVRVGRRHLQLMPEDVAALRAARLVNCQLSASR
jgi:hypothetical protein